MRTTLRHHYATASPRAEPRRFAAFIETIGCFAGGILRRKLIRATVRAGLLPTAGTTRVFADLDSQLQPIASPIPRETVPFGGRAAPRDCIRLIGAVDSVERARKIHRARAGGFVRLHTRDKRGRDRPLRANQGWRAGRCNAINITSLKKALRWRHAGRRLSFNQIRVYMLRDECSRTCGRSAAHRPIWSLDLVCANFRNRSLRLSMRLLHVRGHEFPAQAGDLVA
jgi:hypothetical protein